MHRWQQTNVSTPKAFWMDLIFCLSNNSVLRWFLPPRSHPFCRNHGTCIDFLQKFCRHFPDSAEFCRILQNFVQFCRFSSSKWVGGSQGTFQQSWYFESISFFIFQIISSCGGYYPQAAVHSAELTTEHALISAEILQKSLGFCRILQNSAKFYRICCTLCICSSRLIL